MSEFDIPLIVLQLSASHLSVYPNPAGDRLFIRHAHINGKLSVTLTDVFGGVVLREAVPFDVDEEDIFPGFPLRRSGFNFRHADAMRRKGSQQIVERADLVLDREHQ